MKILKSINIVSTFLLLVFYPCNSFAESGVYRFLSLPSSSHTAALGGENVSIRNNDLSFSFHNPALLDVSMHQQLSFNGVNYLADINFGSAAYAHQLDARNTVAGGVLFVNYGKFIETSENDEILGEFSASDVALYLMYSRVLSENWTLGSTLKPIFSSYESYSSFGLAFDLGLNYYEKEKYFSAGLVLKNIGRQLSGYYEINGREHIEDFPFEIQMGATKKLEHAPFQFSITAQHLEKWDMGFTNNVSTTSITGISESASNELNFGENLMRHFIFDVEFLPSDKFYVAVGYNYRRKKELKVLDNKSMNGFSFGGGLKLSKFQLGFSVARYHVSNSSYHFSISTNLNSFNL